MQLPEINLERITDPAARQLIGQLLNVIETLHAELLELRTENQALRDEMARLKGDSGKPDVSFGPRSRDGARAWDSFQTLIATATKLGVRLYDYLLKRRVAPNETPSLADHIRLRTLLAATAAPA